MTIISLNSYGILFWIGLTATSDRMLEIGL